MDRTEAFSAVYRVLNCHNSAHIHLSPLRDVWINTPHLLPPTIVNNGNCVFSLRSLRFIGGGCDYDHCHTKREDALNAVREWWLADQDTWADAAPPAPEAPQEAAKTDLTPEEIQAINKQRMRYGFDPLTREDIEDIEAANAARAALGIGVISPPPPPETPAKEAAAVASMSNSIKFSIDPVSLEEFAKSLERAILGIESLTPASLTPAIPAPKKKGALTTMAKRTVTGTIKKNALKAAQRTAAKAVKDAGREPLIALLAASSNPLAQEAARLLESPHGDAALSVLIGVIATIALPEKITGNAHVEALLDNLQTDGLEHFTTVAFQVVASPMVSAVSGALMAYGTKMAELEGAVHKLGPGSEE